MKKILSRPVRMANIVHNLIMTYQGYHVTPSVYIDHFFSADRAWIPFIDCHSTSYLRYHGYSLQ